MKLHMVGCAHHDTDLETRQQLAFAKPQVVDALGEWTSRFGSTELVLLSTCNRVELYAAREDEATGPGPDELFSAMVGYHRLAPERFQSKLHRLDGQDATSHLFRVSSSLDSMVVGEAQILSQVKDAYQTARECGTVGTVLNRLFQSALKAARRVASETPLHRHRVSIPSVAIGEFAAQLFERFDDKHVLVIGAGEMADDSLRYLRDVGAVNVHVVNRSADRAEQLAAKWSGACYPWDALHEQLAEADIVLSTTSSPEPVVTAAEYARLVGPLRKQRPLFVMDLSVPRDFDPAVGDELGVYLYSLDDLDRVCQRNLAERSRALPKAEKIIMEETMQFFAHESHRAAAPVITGLRRGLDEAKEAELDRLFHKLPGLDEDAREEIQRFADRLGNKMLHPPMESLRDASKNGTPHGLIDAVRQIFRLDD